MRLHTFLLALLFLACRTEDPPVFPPEPPPSPYERSIDLVVEDVGVIDASLRIRFLDTLRTRVFELRRNGQLLLAMSISAPDTQIVDTTLNPNGSYLYECYRIRDSSRVDSTRDTTVITLDTTSHGFTFQTWYFGSFASSYFTGVKIIAENDVWVVGTVFDSATARSFNAAHFDGVQWTLSRFYYYYPSGDSSVLFATDVTSFSDSELWFAASDPFHWDGDSMTQYYLRGSILFGNESVRNLFGTSTSHVYGVGGGGALVKFNGTSWIEIETGTDDGINDIWGDDTVAVAAVSSLGGFGDKKLLKVHQDNSIDSIPWFSDKDAASVWFRKANRLFVAGEGVFILGLDGRFRRQNVSIYFTRRIRGNDINDVFVVSDGGVTSHFNGKAWKIFPGISDHIFYSCDMKGNQMVAVGQSGNQAVIVVATR